MCVGRKKYFMKIKVCMSQYTCDSITILLKFQKNLYIYK